MAPRKKIIFVIVEGPSDSEALGVILTRMFSQDDVHVHVSHGDITSDSGTTTQNVLIKVAEMVQSYRAPNYLRTSDFLQVVHLIDTDGTFIPESAAVEDAACTEFYYSETEIHGPSRDAIIERNKRKSSIIRRLYSCGKVCKTIPYRAYYMSSNLEHVLHNLQNASDAEKEQYAFSFAMRYKEDIDGFIKFISKSDFSVTGDYKESWNFIQQNLHSLERHTNLGIWFQPSYQESNKEFD